jgi:hypothetical protein
MMFFYNCSPANAASVLLPPTPRFFLAHRTFSASNHSYCFVHPSLHAPQAHGDTVRTRELGGRIAAVVRAVAIAKAEGAVLDRGVLAPVWQPQKMMNLQPQDQTSIKTQQKITPLHPLPQEAPKKPATSTALDDDDPLPSFDSLDDTASSISSCSSKVFEDGFLSSSIKGKSQQQPLALLEEHAKKKRLGSVYVRTTSADFVCTDTLPHHHTVYISKAFAASLPSPKFFVVIGSKTYVPPNG